MNSLQKTIKKKISFTGIGLHSGQPSKIELLPLKENQGIVFNSINSNQVHKIKANWKYLSSANLCTKIKNKKIEISTIEHLMFSLSALGITNILIRINSSEIPIMDGSAKTFVDEIKKIGVLNQKKTARVLKIKKN